MSASAVDQVTPRKPSPSLGSFTVGPRVIDASHRPGDTMLVAVSGSPGTPFEDQTGFAYCNQLTADDPQSIEAAQERLSRMAAFRHASIAPLLETGVADRVAFVVEAGVGERLSDRLTRDGALPIWRVAAYIEALANALHAAHQQDLSHGAISPLTIRVDEAGRPLLGGFGPTHQGAGVDQTQLAALAFELVSGRMWQSVPGNDVAGGALVDRVRGSVDGLSERVAIVIARGLERDHAQQFASVDAFGAAFSEAVALSALEIAAGAWEAVSRQDLGMATILCRMLAGYDPKSPEIALLNHRLSGAPKLDALSGKPVEPILELRALLERHENPDAPVVTSNGASLTEDEMRRLFGGVAIDPQVNRGNPWVIFFAVVFGMIVAMTILLALMFNQN